MATTPNGKTVKLQIPVSADLAERITHLAERFERSQAWLVCEVLHVAMEERRRFANWILANLLGKVNRVFRALGNQSLHNPQIVRLQVAVPAGLAEEIAKLGDSVGHSQVRMAGLLIEWLIDAHEIIMYGASSAPAKAAGRLIFAKPIDNGQASEESPGDPDSSPAFSCEQHSAA